MSNTVDGFSLSSLRSSLTLERHSSPSLRLEAERKLAEAKIILAGEEEKKWNRAQKERERRERLKEERKMAKLVEKKPTTHTETTSVIEKKASSANSSKTAPSKKKPKKVKSSDDSLLVCFESLENPDNWTGNLNSFESDMVTGFLAKSRGSPPLPPQPNPLTSSETDGFFTSPPPQSPPKPPSHHTNNLLGNLRQMTNLAKHYKDECEGLRKRIEELEYENKILKGMN